MAPEKLKTFPVLKTQRLNLRELLMDDANEIFALRSDKNVNKYLGRSPGKSIEDALSFIRTVNENRQTNGSLYWAIELNLTNRLIGTICLFDISEDNTNAEIGYELLPEFQGQGIMQEAACRIIEFAIHDLGLESIEACSHAENRNSAKLLEKLSFKQCGVGSDDLIAFRLKTSSRREKGF